MPRQGLVKSPIRHGLSHPQALSNCYIFDGVAEQLADSMVKRQEAVVFRVERVWEMIVPVGKRCRGVRERRQAGGPSPGMEGGSEGSSGGLRKRIDPTTCERDYSEAEIEFMQALDRYKRSNGRPFPTCSEILRVLIDLGYQKQGGEMLREAQENGHGYDPS